MYCWFNSYFTFITNTFLKKYSDLLNFEQIYLDCSIQLLQRKKEFLKKIVFKMKKGHISRQSCVVRGKSELLQRYFSRIFATYHGKNTIQNACLTEQPFLSKTITGCLWNFSFLELCRHFISNFTCKDTIFKRILNSYYRIFLN